MKTFTFSKRQALSATLTITSGHHKQARVMLDEKSVLTIGRNDAADVVLTDETVQEFHAILSHKDGYWNIKPQGGDVLLDGFRRHDTTPIQGDKQVITLGDVTLTLSYELAPKKNRHRLRGLVYGVLVIFPVVVWAAVGLSPKKVPDTLLTEPLPNSSELNAQELALLETENINSLAALPPLTDASEVITPDVSLAENVQEILRLSGIHALCEEIEPGIVEVTGRFGDGAELARIMKTRAIHDIDGLEKVVSINLDAPPTAEVPKPKPATPKKTITVTVKKVVVGEHSYIVLGNGSQYFEGAVLPNGYRLSNIYSDKITVSKNGRQTTINSAGAVF